MRQTLRPTPGPLTLTVALSLGLMGACSSHESSGPDYPTGRLAIQVAPLSLAGVGEVRYRLTIDNGQSPPRRVVDVALDSTRYGDGLGALSYVAPCDASASPNVATIEILEIRDTSDATIDPTTWRNPGPLSLPADCIANADTSVAFNLTVLRSANQGFFDIAVEFSDIFCSAKLDCVDALLHNGPERDTTVVVAFACAAGQGESTWLYLDPVVVACSDGTQFTVSPGGREGQRGGLAPYFFESAIYRGKELIPGVDKCYWNTAVGIDLTTLPADLDCTLTAHGTAAASSWPMGNTPTGHVYPFIRWTVPIVEDGALVCSQHAVNVPGSGVMTDYTTGATSRHFPFGMACTPELEVVSHGVVCQSRIGEGDAVELISLGGSDVALVVGGEQSAPMRLPNGYALAPQCCQDPCCQP